MLRLFLLTCLAVLIMSGHSSAQYVNTDSLVTVAGYQFPVPVIVLDSLEIYSPEILPGSFIPGQITSGQFLSLFTLPGKGKVISRYGPRSGRMHTGTDIKMKYGDTIYAVFDGVVTKSSWYYGYGNMINISHGNALETRYAHLSKFLVKSGEPVYRGEPIGLAGATGRATTSHLHFEIREHDRPYDPELVYDFDNMTVRPSANQFDRLVQMTVSSGKVKNISDEKKPEHHRVRYGDSLWKISRRYRTSIPSLCRLNNLTENSVLQIGQLIRLQ